METITRVVVLGLAAIGCGDSTELVVHVDTDLHLGNEVMAIEVSAGGFAPDFHRFEITSDTAMPLTFSIGPNEAGGDDDIPIDVQAVDADGETLVSWVATTRFRNGRSLEVLAPLARACTEVECDEELVCRNGVCEARFIDPATLEPSGTHEGRIFDGPSDPPMMMIPPSCEARMEAGEACAPQCPCEETPVCALGLLTCEPDGEEGCDVADTLPYTGTSNEELDAFMQMCAERSGQYCDYGGRECAE